MTYSMRYLLTEKGVPNWIDGRGRVLAYVCRSCGWREQLPPYPMKCPCCGTRMERKP